MSMYNAPGRYTVKVTAMQFGETERGTPGLFFTVEPLTYHGPEGDVQADNTPRTVAYYFSTPENAAISLEQLRRLGWEGTTFKELYDGTWSLVDQELRARCQEDHWTDSEGNQKTSEKWQFLTGTGGMKVNDTTPKAVKDLDARFGHLLKGTNNGAPPPPKPTNNGTGRRSGTPF